MDPLGTDIVKKEAILEFFKNLDFFDQLETKKYDLFASEKAIK